ncbi:MAG TPA: glycine cleavage system aminomethyltransferase GcvT [Thermoplasmata archaeon]|nr:glycine cleavage system aminomethyltransferase GcvT [Thermoplasmata archaeon]
MSVTATAAPTAPAALRRTALFDFHVRHGAHLVPFAGWEMPLYYSSILAEHRAVRSGVGLFDVSHMGLVTVEGGHAADLLSRRTTANIAREAPSQVRYTFFLESTGRIVDDLLVTRLDRGDELTRSFLAVPNAGRADEIEEILRHHRGPDTTLQRWNPTLSLLAVQGPGARALLEAVLDWDLGALAFYHARRFPTDDSGDARAGTIGTRIPSDLERSILVSRTGYTGELGFELLVRSETAPALADRLVAAGAVPCGLGARDTLRLEKGYLLSGQEFHRDRTPLEAGQQRFVELDHPFVGRSALEKERAEGPAQRLVGLVVETPGAIPRHGTPVRADGKVVAELTSGGLSPNLGHGIGLAYLPSALAAPGTSVQLEIRGREVPARVTALPFVRAPPARP